MKKVGSKADNEATEEQNNPEYYSYPEDDLNDYDDNDFDDEVLDILNYSNPK